MSERIDAILIDEAGSFWIKRALLEALSRDPVDAANDAEVLADVLAERADETLTIAQAMERDADHGPDR